MQSRPHRILESIAGRRRSKEEAETVPTNYMGGLPENYKNLFFSVCRSGRVFLEIF
jgi:hypothetical protein